MYYDKKFEVWIKKGVLTWLICCKQNKKNQYYEQIVKGEKPID